MRSRSLFTLLRTSRASVWLALCIAWMGALAPTVSHALAQSQGADPFQQICSANGAKPPSAEPVFPSDSPTGPESGVSLSLTHCPFCLHNADRVAPPPAPVAYLFLDHGGLTDVPAWQAFFYSPNLYTSAAPRGPPLS